MEGKNLHKLAPVTPSGNFLFQRSFDQNIQISKFFVDDNSLIVSHFFNRVFVRMLIVKDFVQDDSQRVDIAFVGVNGFALAIMKENLWGHGVWSTAFFAEDGEL